MLKCFRSITRLPIIPGAATPTTLLLSPVGYIGSRRFKRYEAFDGNLDKDTLAEARSWYQQFEPSQLPKGTTTFARSSGPGGQHVNK
jgi:hypothetical protein